MKIQTGGYSHIGKVRLRNEDSLLIGSNYAVVADGMGGHNRGDIASLMAVASIKDTIEALSDTQRAEVLIKEAVEKANNEIYNYSVENNCKGDMGTTVVACLWQDGVMTIANVGDSRCYCINNGKSEKLTSDHSLVQQLVDSGKITEEEAENREDKNIILRAVGCDKNVDTDIFVREIKNNDIYVLCSDGMSNLVKSDELADGIDPADLQKSLEKLVALANGRGGNDNISVVAIQFTDDTNREDVI